MTSFKFLIYICLFLPVVILSYHFAKEKHRWIVLLAASYLFYILQSGKLMVFLLISTATVFLTGLWLGKLQQALSEELKTAEKEEKKAIKAKSEKKQNRAAALCLIVNFGIIAVLKYSAFFNSVVNSLLSATGGRTLLPVRTYALPLGISFYTMIAASYVLDIRRGIVTPEKNPAKLALFLGFFPQILEGPMCRYSDTAPRLYAGKDIEYTNLCRGLQRIAFGVAKRMLVADRVNNYINFVHTNYVNCDGGLIFISTLCYTFQIYMDFSGTMDIVIGTAEIFGIKLPENFRRPFFSKNASEFWSRWHITLGKWFSDYIFYPISMSKPMKKLTKSARKHIGGYYGPLLAGAVALLAVWICNGIWHGAGWQYLFFGLYYFVIILAGKIIEPGVGKVFGALKIDRGCKTVGFLNIIKTFLIFNLGELFFSAPDLRAAFSMLQIMVRDFSFRALAMSTRPGYALLKDGNLYRIFLDWQDALILLICLAFLIIHGIRAERGKDVRSEIAALKPGWRTVIWAALIAAVFIFGGYGDGYSYLEPIYANF